MKIEKSLIFGFCTMAFLLGMIVMGWTQPDRPTGLALVDVGDTGTLILPDGEYKPITPLQCFIQPLHAMYTLAYWDNSTLSFIPDSIPTLNAGIVRVITDARYWESMSLNMMTSTYDWENEGKIEEPLALGDTVLYFPADTKRFMGYAWYYDGRILRKLRPNEQ